MRRRMCRGRKCSLTSLEVGRFALKSEARRRIFESQIAPNRRASSIDFEVEERELAEDRALDGITSLKLSVTIGSCGVPQV